MILLLQSLGQNLSEFPKVRMGSEYQHLPRNMLHLSVFSDTWDQSQVVYTELSHVHL